MAFFTCAVRAVFSASSVLMSSVLFSGLERHLRRNRVSTFRGDQQGSRLNARQHQRNRLSRMNGYGSNPDFPPT